MEIINSKTSICSMIEPNILFVVMKGDAIVDISEVKENYEAAMKVTNGKRYASLVDARAFATITSEARDYSTLPEMYTNVVAQAVVVTSLANRLLANFLMQFYKKNKTVEMKIFNDCGTALIWLKEKLAEDKSLKRQVIKNLID